MVRAVSMLLMVVCFVMFFGSFLIVPVGGTVSLEEYRALVALYSATNGAEWRTNDRWLEGDPCDNAWYGVECVEVGGLNGTAPVGVVVELDVSTNNLFGTLPDDLAGLRHLRLLDVGYNKLVGTVPDWLGSLTQLRSLDIASNELIVGTIPDSIWQLTRLEFLTVAGCALSGTLSQAVGLLQDLEALHVSHTRLEGSLPWTIGHLTKLRHLDGATSLLGGSVPPSFANLGALRKFGMSHTLLEGGLENLKGLPRLEEIYAAYTLQSGPLPSFGAETPRLRTLSLTGNRFSGTLLDCYGDAPLETLLLQDNDLEGVIPAAWDRSRTLGLINVSINRLHSPLPDLSGMSALYDLDISNNRFTSPLGGNLSSSHLANLHASNNFLTEIPDLNYSKRTKTLFLDGNNITELPFLWINNLHTLDISRNSLHDVDSLTVSYLPSLRSLSVAGNNLATWPDLPALSLWNLYSLDVSNNNITSFPEELHNYRALKFLFASNNSLSDAAALTNITTLTQLVLDGNRLASFPEDLNRWRDLFRFDLSFNLLTGTLPLEICDMPSITFLALSGNNDLGGTIHECIGDWFIKELFLSDCNFEGTLPDVFGDMFNLNLVYLKGNRFTGPIPPSLVQNQRDLQALLLQNNAFSGTLPEGMGHGMRGLLTFIASNNSLTGVVPSTIGSVVALQVLDLQGNALTGLPAELGDLPALQRLDVSRNNLAGTMVPAFQSPQLQHLSVAWNPALGGVLPELAPLSAGNSDVADASSSLQRVLLVDGTALSGTIPTSYGTDVTSFSFSYTAIEGPLSVFSDEACPLRFLNGRASALNGTLPDKGFGPALSSLILAESAGLHGTVPLAVLDSQFLSVMDLSGSGVEGSLAAVADRPRMLTTLDLSECPMLVGSVPTALVTARSMTFLSVEHSPWMRGDSTAWRPSATTTVMKGAVDGELYQCRGVEGEPQFHFSPEYFDFGLCQCMTTAFGYPPDMCESCEDVTGAICDGGAAMTWEAGYYPVCTTPNCQDTDSTLLGFAICPDFEECEEEEHGGKEEEENGGKEETDDGGGSSDGEEESRCFCKPSTECEYTLDGGMSQECDACHGGGEDRRRGRLCSRCYVSDGCLDDEGEEECVCYYSTGEACAEYVPARTPLLVAGASLVILAAVASLFLAKQRAVAVLFIEIVVIVALVLVGMAEWWMLEFALVLLVLYVVLLVSPKQERVLHQYPWMVGMLKSMLMYVQTASLVCGVLVEELGLLEAVQEKLTGDGRLGVAGVACMWPTGFESGAMVYLGYLVVPVVLIVVSVAALVVNGLASVHIKWCRPKPVERRQNRTEEELAGAVGAAGRFGASVRVKKRKREEVTLKQRVRRNTWRACVHATLFLLFALYFELANVFLGVFDCQGEYTADGIPSGRSYVGSMEWMECTWKHGTWVRIVMVAVVGLLVYVVGVFVLFTTLIWRRRGAVQRVLATEEREIRQRLRHPHQQQHQHRRHGHHDEEKEEKTEQQEEDEEAVEPIAFLFEGYRSDRYWFEVWVMMRRLALAGAVALTPEGSALQATSVVAVLAVSMVMQFYHQPYNQLFPLKEHSVVDTMEIGSFGTVAVSYIAVFAAEVMEEASRGEGEAAAGAESLWKEVVLAMALLLNVALLGMYFVILLTPVGEAIGQKTGWWKRCGFGGRGKGEEVMLEMAREDAAAEEEAGRRQEMEAMFEGIMEYEEMVEARAAVHEAELLQERDEAEAELEQQLDELDALVAEEDASMEAHDEAVAALAAELQALQQQTLQRRQRRDDIERELLQAKESLATT